MCNCDLPWPELAVPAGLDEAALRRVVSGGPRLVWGEGFLSAGLGLIMDNPGLREDRDGVPFVCPTRQTLRQALRQAGVAEQDVQVFFLYKARPRRAYDRQAANALYLPILQEQVHLSSAKVLLGLGDTVLRAMFGEDAAVRTMRGRWQTFCDLPLLASYHPLAARRRPNLGPLLVQDIAMAWTRLRQGGPET